MNERPDLAIIGPGKVGTALAVGALRVGWRVVAIGGRDAGRTATVAGRIGQGVRADTPAGAASQAGLVLLTVRDDAIEGVCRELSAGGALKPGAVVAHCSGALSSEVLESARAAGCYVGSLHPLATFPTVESAIDRLGEAFFFCEGQDRAVEVLERLARDVGARVVRIAPAAKALYHAAAVMACNHLTALLDASLALAQRAGIDPATAWEALAPLVRATLDNVAAMGPAQALTGPVARGDAATVARHLEALKTCPPALADFFAAAARWTLDLATRTGTLKGLPGVQIARLLGEASTEG